MKSFVRVFKWSGFVQSGSFVNTRDGWEQRFNLASWKSQCPRKPWENLSWETCQTQRMATWMERYVPSAKRRRWRYDYISDYECIFNHPVSHAGNKQEYWKKLQDAKTRLGGTTMQIRELAHFTNPEAADQIVNDHGFRGGLKKINKDKNDDDIIANLSWWSPIFTEDERKNVREHLGEVIKSFTDEKADDLDALKNQFATSDAFQPNPLRYGNHLFQYEINELCDRYSQLIDGEPPGGGYCHIWAI